MLNVLKLNVPIQCADLRLCLKNWCINFTLKSTPLSVALI